MKPLLTVGIIVTHLLSPQHPPMMCYDKSNALDVRCSGTQQFLPPGYNRDDSSTWYRCWYSEAC